MNIPYCNNCGYEGHLYRNCKLPVLSYGVLIVRIPDKQVLMVQRKDSIAYIEFLRGKYKLDDKNYILKLLNSCSIKERLSLGSLSFNELWNNLWSLDETFKKTQTDRMNNEYKRSKHMFETLQETELQELLSKSVKKYETPEWEFPKGRRSNRETNIKCAMREFEEETDLSSDEYILLENVSPISEEYTGSNGVRYKHIYYYAIYKGSKDNQVINRDKYEQYTEIGDIKWLTIDECYSKIREENPTKNDIIHKIDKFVINCEKDFIITE